MLVRSLPAADSPPSLPTRSRPRSTWRQLVLSYTDWNGPLMLRVAWCESRDEPWVVDPTPVWDGSRWVHSAGLLQVLGGSTDPLLNIRQAHALWEQQGMAAWFASRSCWG